MSSETTLNRLWTVVVLENKLFALPVENVQTMVVLPDISHVPNLPEHVRGVMNLRGSVMPVVDLRMRLGIIPFKDEVNSLIELLSNRQKDHEHWLEELQISLIEKKEFKLTTNPHNCAFGLWYDTFKTNNLILSSHLKKFDEPHKQIHAIAEKVLSLRNLGKETEAQNLIDATRNGDLAIMISLFSSLKSLLIESMKEIAIVLTTSKKTFAVTVDSVETVCRLSIDKANNIRTLGLQLEEQFLFESVGNMEKSGDLVITLNPEHLYEASE